MSSAGAPYEFLYKVEIPVFWAESKRETKVLALNTRLQMRNDGYWGQFCPDKAWCLMDHSRCKKFISPEHFILHTDIKREEQLFYKIPVAHQPLAITFSLQTGSRQVHQTDGHLASSMALFSGENWQMIKACHLHWSMQESGSASWCLAGEWQEWNF